MKPITGSPTKGVGGQGVRTTPLPSEKSQLEYRESYVLPAKTEVKQGKSVQFISPANGYFRETYKSQNISPVSPTTKFTLGIIQIIVKSLSTILQCLVQ